jgi:AbrB family looped-hinge helix DNA binding protein
MSRKTILQKTKEPASGYAAVRPRRAALEEIYQTSITSKGQMVIPANLRRKYGITPKTRIVLYEEDERIVLMPVTTEKLIEELRGSLKGTGVLKTYMEEKAREIEREDANRRRPR